MLDIAARSIPTARHTSFGFLISMKQRSYGRKLSQFCSVRLAGGRGEQEQDGKRGRGRGRRERSRERQELVEKIVTDDGQGEEIP